MPRTLLLMRHAKSSWDNSRISDHDRPLNPRGLRDAPRMGRYLTSQKLVPDAIVSSTANRALTTAHLIAEHCDRFDSDVIEDANFYHAPPDVYLERAALLDDSTQTAMFVGHNPGMEAIASTVGGDHESMSTAAIMRIEFDVESWSDVESFSQATLAGIWRPKEIS